VILVVLGFGLRAPFTPFVDKYNSITQDYLLVLWIVLPVIEKNKWLS